MKWLKPNETVISVVTNGLSMTCPLQISVWQPKSSIDTGAFGDVVELAREFTGMPNVRVENRTQPLSDNNSSPVSSEFGKYLEAKGLRPVFA